MPIHIHLANLIICKTAIEEKVVGGIYAFRSSLLFQGNQLNQEDDDVFSLTRMNPDEFDLDTLIALGLDYNEQTFSSTDFTIVTRYGGMLWQVDWLEHDTTYAWHVSADSSLIDLAKSKSDMLMDDVVEMLEKGEQPFSVIATGDSKII
jgi:environmental stress-induced protein Ves